MVDIAIQATPDEIDTDMKAEIKFYKSETARL